MRSSAFINVWINTPETSEVTGWAANPLTGLASTATTRPSAFNMHTFFTDLGITTATAAA